MTFDFVDLFAGIGGFHAALSAMGGRAVLASEIDRDAATIYRNNWGLAPTGDVRDLAANATRAVPGHAVLAAGFPCQPFSKSGRQLGFNEVRGQLFGEILKVLDAKRPPVVILENVRNIAGPRQRHVWNAIVEGLRETGYRTPSDPCVYSPHLLARSLGGSPQTRDRAYILGTYVGRERAMVETDVEPVLARRPSDGWSPSDWNLDRDLLELDHKVDRRDQYLISEDERTWIRVWNDFLARTRRVHLPGFPLWSAYWRPDAAVDARAPEWKQHFEAKNIDFYNQNRRSIDAWIHANPELRAFPASRRKLEWQAGDTPRDLRLCLLQFRPSGIRAKRLDYAPALVAMTQTPVVGPRLRRLTLRESARLQGFPDWFSFDGQTMPASYKQLGNAVHSGVVYQLLRKHVLQDASDIATSARGQGLVRAASESSEMCIVPDPRFAGERRVPEGNAVLAMGER